MMQVKIIEDSGREMKFEVSGVSTRFLNMLRRTIISWVPTVAIEKVEIIENSSGMYNEILVHRLGLIPLSFDPEIDLGDDKAVLILEKQGPCEVVSGDLKSSSDTVKPLYGDIPIVRLLEGQNLKIVCYVRTGKGKEHAKWQGGIMGYTPYATVKVLKSNKEISGILGIDEGHSKTIPYTDQVAMLKRKYPENIEVKMLKNRFMVEVESVSGYSATALLEQSLKNIKERLEAIEKGM